MYDNDDMLPIERFGADKGANVGGGTGLNLGGGTGSGAQGFQDFWSSGGSDLANTVLAGLFDLPQTGIRVETSKKAPAAAQLLSDYRGLQAQYESGAMSPAQMQAQLQALAQQNAAMLAQLQQPKSSVSPALIVGGVLVAGLLTAVVAVMATRRTGAGARNDVYDLDRSDWHWRD